MALLWGNSHLASAELMTLANGKWQQAENVPMVLFLFTLCMLVTPFLSSFSPCKR